MTDRLSAIVIVEELRQGLRFKRINEELLEVLKSTIVWLVRYADKNKIELPSDEIVRRLDQAQALVNQIHSYKPSDESLHGGKDRRGVDSTCHAERINLGIG